MKAVTDLYDQIIVIVSPNKRWEDENGHLVQQIIEMTLNRLGSYSLAPLENKPVPPPDWQAVHIGNGIFVKEENPELNCEVG